MFSVALRPKVTFVSLNDQTKKKKNIILWHVILKNSSNFSLPKDLLGHNHAHFIYRDFDTTEAKECVSMKPKLLTLTFCQKFTNLYFGWSQKNLVFL